MTTRQREVGNQTAVCQRCHPLAIIYVFGFIIIHFVLVLASIPIDHTVQRLHHLCISEKKLQLASIDSLGCDGILSKAQVPSMRVFLIPVVLQGDFHLSILCGTIVEVTIVQDSLHNHRIQIAPFEETALETTRSVIFELINVNDRTIGNTCAVCVFSLGCARGLVDAKPCSV